VAGCCEHGDEPSGCIITGNIWEFRDWVMNG